MPPFFLPFLFLVLPFQGGLVHEQEAGNSQKVEAALSFVMTCRAAYLDSLGSASPCRYSEDRLFKTYGATQAIRDRSLSFLRQEAKLRGKELSPSVLRFLGVPEGDDTQTIENVTWFAPTEKGYLSVVRDPKGAYQWHQEWRRLSDGTGVYYSWAGENEANGDLSIELSSWKHPDRRPGVFSYPDEGLMRVLRAFEEGREHPERILWFPSAKRAEFRIDSEEYERTLYQPTLGLHVLFDMMRWDARIVVERVGSEWRVDFEVRTRDGRILQHDEWSGMRDGLPFLTCRQWHAWPGTDEPYLVVRIVQTLHGPEEMAPMLVHPSLEGRMVTDHRTDTAIEYPWPKEIPSAAWVAQKALARGR